MVEVTNPSAKGRIDRTVARLAERIGKRAAGDLVAEFGKLATKGPPTAMGVLITAAAAQVLEDWFYGRDPDLDEAV